MNLADAAERILRQQRESRPMHYRTITHLAIEQGLVTSRGLTPEASLNAAISTDIGRRADAGEEERFIAYGRGFYGLATQRLTTELEETVRRNNREVRSRLLAELLEMASDAFEDLVGRLLEALGFIDVEVTGRSGDGGVDVRGTLAVGGITNVKTAIQVKRWAKNVSGRTVRELRGGLSPHELGLIITTAGFTRDAKAEAETSDRAPISLVDGQRLVSLLIEHGIGVVRLETRILRLDPEALLGSLPGLDDDVNAGDRGSEDGQDGRVLGKSRRSKLLRRPAGKNLSLWPLPGGQRRFVQSMWRILKYVSNAEPTPDELIEWMLQTFRTVRSRETAKGYIDVPRSAGLVQTRGDRLVLTADAAASLASNDEELLFQTMDSNIAGLADTAELLIRGPRTLGEVTAFLNEQLGTSWQTDNQARWRLLWLESFGRVERTGDRWQTVEDPSRLTMAKPVR